MIRCTIIRKKEYIIGDRTQHWDEPVDKVSDDNKLPSIFTTCSLWPIQQEIKDQQTLIVALRQSYLLKQFWGHNCSKSRVIINKSDPSLSILTILDAEEHKTVLKTASSTDSFTCYANWNQSSNGSIIYFRNRRTKRFCVFMAIYVKAIGL